MRHDLHDLEPDEELGADAARIVIAIVVALAIWAAGAWLAAVWR